MVIRDRSLALICDAEIPVLELKKAIQRGTGKLLENIKGFDVYRGEQIAHGKKSVAISVVLRSANATLTDEQVNNAIQKAIKELEKVGANLRT